MPPCIGAGRHRRSSRRSTRGSTMPSGTPDPTTAPAPAVAGAAPTTVAAGAAPAAAGAPARSDAAAAAGPAGPPVPAAPRRRHAVVGTGSRAGMFVRSMLTTHAEVAEPVAWCDTNDVRMDLYDELLAEHGRAPLPRYTPEDFSRMLDEQDPDVVVVTSPDSTHARYVVEALDRGVDVVCEKPMTIDVDGLRAITEAARRSTAELVVTFNYRYSPRNSEVRRLVSEGAIGDVTSVTFEWLLDTVHGADYFRRWHREKASLGRAARAQVDAPPRPRQLVDRRRPRGGQRARPARLLRRGQRRRARPGSAPGARPRRGGRRPLRPRHGRRRDPAPPVPRGRGGGRLRPRPRRLRPRHHDRGQPRGPRRLPRGTRAHLLPQRAQPVGGLQGGDQRHPGPARARGGRAHPRPPRLGRQDARPRRQEGARGRPERHARRRRWRGPGLRLTARAAAALGRGPRASLSPRGWARTAAATRCCSTTCSSASATTRWAGRRTTSTGSAA